MFVQRRQTNVDSVTVISGRPAAKHDGFYVSVMAVHRSGLIFLVSGSLSVLFYSERSKVAMETQTL